MKAYFYTIILVLCFVPNFSKAQIILSSQDTLVCKGNTVSVQAKLDSINWLGDVVSLPLPPSYPPYSVSIGFPFLFFGDTFYIQQTGTYNFILFKDNLLPNYSTSLYDWLSFSNSFIGSQTIYLGTQSLYKDSLSSILVQTVGNPGNRKHIVYLCNMAQMGNSNPFVDCSGNRVSNYAILYEGSNIIEIHTVNMPGSTVCPYYDNNTSIISTGVQGLRYVKNNVVNEVFSPGRGPYDYWGHTGGQYTSRRFTPIPNYPFYQVDTIPFQNWDVIDYVDSNTFFWYDANGVLVGQGPVLNALATAPNGQDSTFFRVNYTGPSGCNANANFNDTFWVHFYDDYTLIDTAICQGSTYNFLGKIVTSPGTYDTLFVNNNGCDSLVSLQLSWLPLPEAQIQGSDSAITCEGVFHVFTTDSLPGYSYQWYYNGNMIANASSSTYGSDQAGFYTVKVTDEKGCSQLSAPVYLSVLPQPKVHLTADRQSLCAGDTIRLEAEAAENVQFQWFPPEPYLDTVNTSTNRAILLTPGQLWVQVTDENGCSGRDTVGINTYSCCNIFLPNAFTPNGDGKNDDFRPNLGPGKTIIDMKVYSRWGNIVYQCYSNTCTPWNGKDLNGKQADMGVYMYYIKYRCSDGKMYYAHGEINLIR